MRVNPLALVVCLLTGLLPRAVQAADAMWVWERATESIIEGPDRDAELQKLLDFCAENFIDEIYMSVLKVNPNNPDAQQPSMLIPANEARWEQVLAALHDAGIRVEALSGKGDWLMPTGLWTTPPLNFPLKEDRGYGLGVLDDILQYQSDHQGSPQQQFDGVHLDIEIQTLVPDDPNPGDDTFELYPDPRHAEEEIDELKRIGFFLQFIDQVVAARTAAGYDPLNLPFNWDISMNYDLGPSASAPGHASLSIDYPDADGGGNVTKPAWQHIFDRLERIAFLTYSDRIRPIAAQMKRELAYVAALAIPPLVRFSFEFQDRFRNNNLASVGLGNEDRLAYINLRQNADALMIGRDYYAGWAMHTYDNINANNGDYQTWVNDNPPMAYPPAGLEDFESSDAAITLPTRPLGSQDITDPVYVRLKLQADPGYVYTSGFSVRSMMSLVPIGYGYASEADLENLNQEANPANDPNRWYDGAAPVGWFYFKRPLMRWWRPGVVNDPTETSDNELVSEGVCWPNPATAQDPQLGVERDIVLQRDEFYRFVLIYNGPTGAGILEFASVPLCGLAPPDNSPNNPLEVRIVLGELANLASLDLEHSNTSVTIVDNDGDELLDVQEMLMGTDRCNPASPASLALVEAVSRKSHDATNYDIDLLTDTNGTPVDYDPINHSGGTIAIECRRFGPTQVVLTFNQAIDPDQVSVQTTHADLAGTPQVMSNTLTIGLSDVVNREVVDVEFAVRALASGAFLEGNVYAGALEGDTTGNGSVTSADVRQTRLRSTQPVGDENFRNDVTANDHLTSADVRLVRLRSAQSLNR